MVERIRVAPLVLAVSLAAGCTSTGPTLSATLSATASIPDAPPSEMTSLSPVSGPPVRIDAATLSADSRVLTLSFTGGPEYVADDPCSKAYAGHADEVSGELDATVLDVTPPATLPDGMACTLAGYPRSITVSLTTPFLGSRLVDRAGYVLFMRRPDGLVQFSGIPSGWLLRSERTVEESPTGRWERVYSLDPVPAGYPELRELDIFQSFDGPVYVSGEGPMSAVQIGATSGTLTGPDISGEMVLEWYVDGDDLALVANSADFTPAALIALAETANAH